MKISILVFLLFHNVLGITDRTWWKYTTIYQVLLPSYMDSNGDGYGDLKGLQSKLGYLKDLGIETILLTPYSASPSLQYAGYDIINYKEVNRIFGSMQDFEDLIEEMDDKGMKLIIDMVINHSSDQHPWFIKSLNREYPYTDYYIWKDAKGYDCSGNPIPPNNWQGMFDGSAWKWYKERNQFCFHQFIEQMPDMNLGNPLVVKEFKKVFEFWSDKGVAGFRLDAADHFMEDAEFRNQPLKNSSALEFRGRQDQLNIHLQFVDESYEVVHKFRSFIDYLSEDEDFERILVVETNGHYKDLYKYYGSKMYKVTHFPLNYWLNYASHYENAYYYRNAIDGFLDGLPEGAVANWNSENHDIPRKAAVFTEEYEFILTTMVLLLPGVAYIYYGQELGLAGYRFPDKTIDSFRLPMQWDDTKNAGFSNNSVTYLPVSPDYKKNNVKIQKPRKNSHYNKVKKMISWRKLDIIKHGSFKSHIVSTWVYSFSRRLGDEIFLVIFNLGKDTEFVDLNKSIDNLPNAMIVRMASRNSKYRNGHKVKTDQKFKLKPQATVVLYSKKQ